MGVQKEGNKPSQRGDHKLEPVTTDKRFAHVHHDPRFLRAKKKDSKVTIDKRFKSMLNSKEFSSAPKVDKYGRRVEQNNAEKELKRFYHVEDDEDQEDSQDEDSVYGNSEKTLAELEKELEEDEGNLESDEEDFRQKRRGGAYDPMRGKGVIDSSDEDTTDEELDEEDEEESLDEMDKIPTGEATRRLAAVNMDWDNIKAIDIFKVLSGFKTSNSSILSVTIYPSEFGKERMKHEDLEGPPKEIFEPKKPPASKNSNQDDSGDEFDQEALRRYQLDRLKYYYAVIECDSVEAAQAIYQACDKHEFEASANFFDLRYIPDDMTFDDEPKDRATYAPDDYVPHSFITNALQHTKVKLTWDQDDPDRTKVMRREFTATDLQSLDFEIYLASSDSEEEDEDDVAALREKYKKLLEGEEKSSTYDGRDHDEDGDMEISFTPGLSEAAAAAVQNKLDGDDEKEETTIEKYMRKQREKRQARKERRAKSVEQDADESEDEIEDDPYFKEAMEEIEEEVQAGAPSEKDEKKKKNKKDKKDKKGKKKLSKEEREEESRKKAELELLMGDVNDKGEGFDMRDVIKHEKAERKKGKKNKKKLAESADGAQEDFEIDVNDPRFAAIHDSHHFAIDPTNPHFKKTKSMQKLLAARQSKTNKSTGDSDQWKKDTAVQKESKSEESDKKASEKSSLAQLVASVKRKGAVANDKVGKRQKS